MQYELRKAICSLQRVGKPCTLCLYKVLLLVNICHLLLCIRDNICMGHGVRMDQKTLGTVAHQVGVWATVFENWFSQNFVSHVAGLKKPVILLFDGHRSYLTYNTIKTGIDKRIIIICIPPSTGHALQPLHVGVFFRLRGKWRKILLRYFLETRIQAVEKGSFPTLLKQLWERKWADHLSKGFHKFWPFNRHAFDLEKCITEVVIKENNSSLVHGPDTPQKCLQRAIIDVTAPPPSEETQAALANAKKPRKRMQGRYSQHKLYARELQRKKPKQRRPES